LQDRQHEAGRLAGAGLRGGEQIAAREHRGDRFQLNRGRLLVADVADRTHEGVGQAKACKGHGFFRWPACRTAQCAAAFIDQPIAGERGDQVERVSAPRQD
jgi:hypothetical protein